MKRLCLIIAFILVYAQMVCAQGTPVIPYIDSFWRDIIDESDTETYGLDLSTGTWSSGVMNWDANPNVYASGTRIIDFNDTDYNAFFGSDAFDNDPGQYNIGIGYQAGYNNDASGAGGLANLYLGYQSGYGVGASNTGAYNVGVGYHTLYDIRSGQGNVAVGHQCLENVTTASYCFGIGYEAGRKITTGGNNSALGAFALQENLTCTNNVAIGARALEDCVGLSAVGYNVAIGYAAARLMTTGRYQTIIGGAAGYNLGAGTDGNVFIGYYSGFRQTTNSNLLIIDNQDRGTVNNESNEALLYGTFAADPNTYPNQQTLKVNGVVSTSNIAHTLAAAATTFICTSNVMTITGDGGGNSVATITGANSGTLLTLIFVDANITLTDTDAHTANTVDCAGTATDFTSADDKILQIVFDGTSWYEVSRSVN